MNCWLLVVSPVHLPYDQLSSEQWPPSHPGPSFEHHTPFVSMIARWSLQRKNPSPSLTRQWNIRNFRRVVSISSSWIQKGGRREVSIGISTILSPPSPLLYPLRGHGPLSFLSLSPFLLSLDSSSTSMLSQVKLSTLSTHKTSGSSRRREGGGGGGWRGEEDAQDEDSRTNSPYSCDIYYVIVWGVKRADMSKPMLSSSVHSSLRHGRGREKTDLDPSRKEIIPECQCSNPRHMMHGM